MKHPRIPLFRLALTATLLAACAAPPTEPEPPKEPAVATRTLDEVLEEYWLQHPPTSGSTWESGDDAAAQLADVEAELEALEARATRSLQRNEPVSPEQLGDITAARERRAQVLARVIVETPLDRPVPTHTQGGGR